MSHNQDHLDRLVAQLVSSCDNPGSPLWLDALKDRFAEVAQATGGAHVIIEVAVTGRTPFRVGILSDGRVLHPMGRRDPWDIRLQGDPAEIARFVLGGGTLLDAQYDGLLVLASPVPSISHMVGRLRRLIGRELCRLLEGSVAVVVAWRRPVDRLRGLAPSVPQVAFAADCTARAVIAACTIFAPTVASTRLHTTPVTTMPSTTADPIHRPPGVVLTTPNSQTRPRPAPDPTAVRSAEPGRDIARAGVETTTARPGGETREWLMVEVDCEHGLGRTLCAIADQLSPVVPTAAPGTADRP